MNKHSKSTHLCRKGISSVPRNSRLSQFMSKPVDKREHAKKVGQALSEDEMLRRFKEFQDKRARQFNRRVKRDQKAASYRAAESARIRKSMQAQRGA